MTKKGKSQRRANQRGGLLVMNTETDLINTHMCNLKPDKKKETIADEMYTYNGTILPFNRDTAGFVLQMFKQSEHKWFKFVIFNNDGENYIYLVNGGQINKHSVCMLIGVLDVTLAKQEYGDIREAVFALETFKLTHLPETVFSTPELMQELQQLKTHLDQLVSSQMPCMPVVSAGSGTVLPDKTICINNKSGHYKPTTESMELAKHIFEANTGLSVTVSEKPDKQELQRIYGDRYEQYTGMCL